MDTFKGFGGFKMVLQPIFSGQSLFENRVLPVNHENKWLPRLPNLTPCDFFL